MVFFDPAVKCPFGYSHLFGSKLAVAMVLFKCLDDDVHLGPVQ